MPARKPNRSSPVWSAVMLNVEPINHAWFQTRVSRARTRWHCLRCVCRAPPESPDDMRQHAPPSLQIAVAETEQQSRARGWPLATLRR